MSLLTTAGLGKDFGAVTAVHALDLAVERGEIFGLLGPNGAGKTTAISMICGVLTPTRGTARIAGHDILSEPFPARRSLGYAPQELAVYEELTADRNLRFFGRLYGLSGRTLGERVDWALEIAGLADRAREPVSQFSGGMKRRLNLVASLLHRPSLLVLDEPTVGVDPQSRNHLFETIRHLGDDGITVVYTSHYMEEVEALCDRVAIVDGGRCVALDTVAGLVAREGDAAIDVTLEGGGERGAEVAAAVDDVTRTETGVRAPSPAVLARALLEIERRELAVVSIDTVQSNLERVFLSLTGHSLRDGT